jgi:hypothetical protein
MFKHKRLLLAVGLGVSLLMTVCSSTALAQNVTQGYLSDQTLQNGMIIRLKPGDAKKVEALKLGDAADMLGVVVANSDAPVSLSDPAAKQTFVATFGKYDVLVSSQNGPIKSGDFVTISALDGVGMKSDSHQELVLGKALADFKATNDGEGRTELADSTGAKKEVLLKRIPVDISVAHNPVYKGDAIPGVPQFLTKAAGLVTNKPVTALRLYACLAIIVLSLAVAGGIIYAGVRTGMTAVGRNPLAKKSIYRNLISVTLMAVIIVIIGVIAVYLLLKI